MTSWYSCVLVLILADRGYSIHESAGLYKSNFHHSQGERKLSEAEIDKLSHVRIHVERVIGLVR